MRYLALTLALFVLVACSPSSAPASPTLCDEATFVDHVIVDAPVQDGTVVMPGMVFTKTWQVTNSGTCQWTTDYALVHTDGDAMGAAAEYPLPAAVAPGETVDLAVPMTVPATSGALSSEWMLRNADGQTFGVGPEADRPLTAEVTVAELPAGVSFDFTQAACLARWDSGRAQFLPCDDASDEAIGYILLPPNGTIQVKPNNQGWIAGYFPAVVIQEGDRFVATAGCVDEEANCDVAFILQARTIEGQFDIGDARIATDDDVVEFDIGLSEFAGQQVAFILYMEENGGRSQVNVGYWRNASIRQ
jgi:hypothetical protein